MSAVRAVHRHRRWRASDPSGSVISVLAAPCDGVLAFREVSHSAYVFGGCPDSVFKPSTLIKKLEKTVCMATTISVTAGSNRRILSP